jgi:hypothetical protein
MRFDNLTIEAANIQVISGSCECLCGARAREPVQLKAKG